MSRRKTYYSSDRLRKKSSKLNDDVLDFIQKSLTNGHFNKLIDYTLLNKVCDHLSQLKFEKE